MIRRFLASAPDPIELIWRIVFAILAIWFALSLASCSAVAATTPAPSPNFRTAERLEYLARNPELVDHLQLAAVPVPQDDNWHYSGGISTTGGSVAFTHAVPFRRKKRPADLRPPTADLPPFLEPTPIPGTGRPFVLRPPRPIKPEPPSTFQRSANVTSRLSGG